MSDFSPRSSSETTPGTGTPKPPSIRVAGIGEGVTWVGDAFRIYAANLPMWILFIVLFYFVNLAMAMVPFAGQLLAPMMMAGMMLACRAMDHGEGMRFDHFIAGCTEKPIPLLILGVFYLAATIVILIIVFIVGFATMGASILMGPGLTDPQTAVASLGLSALLSILLVLLVVLALTLPLAMAYWFAAQLVQFDDVQPWEAVKLSFMACLKNFWPFLLYGVVMLVLFALVFAPFWLAIPKWLAVVIAVLGTLFVGVPVTIATMYTSYKSCFGNAPSR
jgi:hypothetical protein